MSMRVLSILLGLMMFFPMDSKSNHQLYSQQRYDDLGVVISGVQVEYSFGNWILFKAHIEPADLVDEIHLFLQVAEEPIRGFKIIQNGDVNVSLKLDAAQNFFRPFNRIHYWYQVKSLTSGIYLSEKFWFNYVDNQINWQTEKMDEIQVFWYQKENSFGQSVLNIIQVGLRKAQGILPGEIPETIMIYIYPNPSEFMRVMQANNLSGISGHTIPENNVILAAISSGDDEKLEMERILPHEIMHLQINKNVHNRTTFLPAWLNEGLASMNEINPNPEYSRIFLQSISTNSWMPIQALCTKFPDDPSKRYLAYAQSESFVRFLYQNYGSQGLQSLLDYYKDGIGCVEGVQKLTGNTMEKVELLWIKKISGSVSSGEAWYQLIPYFFMFGVILIPPFVMVFRSFYISKPNRIGKKPYARN